MRKFETIIIFKTGCDDAVKNAVKKYERFFRAEDTMKARCRKVEVNTIGEKQLAYSIKDIHADPDSGENNLYEHGFYVTFKHFSTEKEIERLKVMLRADILVLKFFVMDCDESYEEDTVYEQCCVDLWEIIMGNTSCENTDVKEMI